jgi:hypothetical protein
MKKNSLAFLSAFLFCLFTSAQLTTEDSVGITRERWRDSTFRMDMQYVTTGILLEYSLFPFEAAKYDGLNSNDDTLKYNGHLYMLHSILKNSIVNSNANLPETDTLFTKAYWYNQNTGKIPFTLVYQSYNRIRQSSLSEGLFTIDADSVGILDVLPRSVSPYDTCYAFFAAPFKTTITQFNAISFYFPDSLWQMTGITSISINFDDGAGYRTLTKDTTFNIYYATEGLKYITVQISTAGGTRTAKCQIDYKRPATWSPPSDVWNFEVDPVYTDDDDYLGGGSRIMDDELFCGGSFQLQVLCDRKVGARVEVELGCDNVFDRPVIIVEGFDPEEELTIEELRRRFSATYPFIQTLRAYGFDLVYVDFYKNGDYIEHNAKVLEAIINKVNQEKTGTHGNNIIGFSMGGLITRWCLRDMEERSIDHEVDNYFSYDAPHQGVNIPLGMQYLFKEIERDLPYLRWFNIGGFKEIAKANESAAARQMLVTKPRYLSTIPLSSTLTPLREAFAERLIAKGYPEQTTNYGIAFGRGDNTASTKDAGNGVQWNNFVPGTKIFEGNMTWFLVNFTSSAFAVPENNNNSYIARYRFLGLTFRSIFGIPIGPTLVLRVRNFKYTGQYPYDDAPGSFELTQAIFAETLDGWANGAAVDATTYDHFGHNFVSTASALDLQNQTYDETTEWQSDNMFFNIDNLIQNPGTVTGNTLSNATLSPFTAVITSTSDVFSAGNQFHNQDISNAVALFILRKILNANPSFNCTNDAFCNVNPGLSGPDLICTNGQYQITNLPTGLNINWEILNGLAKIDNGQGTNTINVSKLSNGNETIRVTLTNSCGTSRVVNKSVHFGPYSSSDYPISGPSSACKNQSVSFSTNDLAGATNYQWTWSSNWSYTSGQGTRNLSLTTGSTTGNFPVTVRVDNSCGNGGSAAVKTVFVNNCGGRAFTFTVSPNPTTGGLNITAVQDRSKTNGILNIAKIYQIKILDQSGNTLKHFNYLKGIGSTNIDLRNLTAGVYTICAYNGVEWSYKQIVKQ